MKLHMSIRSPFARRIRLLLEEMKIPHETSVVDVFVAPKWYLEVNPLARVPALELSSGEFIVDSNQIVTYLREQYPAHPIFNTQGVRSARALNWSGLANGAMEWMVTWFLEGLKAAGMRDSETIEEAEGAIMRAFNFFENELRGSSGYLAGANLGVWDLDLGAAYGYAKLRLKSQIDGKYPAIEAYYERLMKRESFQKSVPPPMPS